MKNKLNVIVCPKCGREYLPAEIYVPGAFFGNPETVLREDGKIIDFGGFTMDLKETYTCDGCDTVFDVTAKMTFETSVNEPRDFSSDYEKSLNLGLKLAEN